MRSFPATGRRILQAISTRHIQSVTGSDASAVAPARRGPATALATGAAVVAFGAMLIPGGHAAAQTVPAALGDSPFTTADVQPGELQLSAPEPHAEDTTGPLAVVAANLDQLTNPTDAHEHAADEHPAEQPAAEQPAAEEHQDQPQPAEQPAAEQQPAEQPAPAPEPAPAPAPVKPDWSSPAPGAPISNPYHKTNASYAAGFHTGTDFAVAVGTPLVAVGDSTVVSSGWAGAYGNQIVLKLSDGRFAQYAHLSQLEVKAGQHVGAGDRIGKSGNTGNSTGPHLHFEIRTANQYAKVTDPIGYLKGHGANNF
ncbi:M23 family metallopeptidase [Kitasatospora sp. NPDC059795]|uniref:M23 family metallopeptidase n=1 Tax=Kitasatospora sp. NPDC059795 TaxID=3346949 RepID=UPI00364A4767